MRGFRGAVHWTLKLSYSELCHQTIPVSQLRQLYSSFESPVNCASKTTQKLLVVGGRIHGKNPLRNYIRSGPLFFIETDKDKVRGEKELAQICS